MTRPSLPWAVLPSVRAWPLHNALATRGIEARAIADAPPHALMQRAGLAVARLALAVAPTARSAWIAAGPGNNGGDGLVAAVHLRAAGWRVSVSLLADPLRLPFDAAWALDQARAAGVAISADPAPSGPVDLAIDALLGLGSSRAPSGDLAVAVGRLNSLASPVLSIDLPTGLCGDRGRLLGDEAVRAEHTLSLLTLKPGLFTAQGRDHAGRVWWDDLSVEASDAPPTATLVGPPPRRVPLHSRHKGSQGDLIVLGGAPGMGGAALLAARAGLAAGVGRVYLARLDGNPADIDPARPELMPRAPADILVPASLASSTVVCGCGGGVAVRQWLPRVLHHAARLVLDADALNAISEDSGLEAMLRQRAGRRLPTVLTPHPLEAARLLRTETGAVQFDRPSNAVAMAARLGCHVVLKGSGTLLASPEGIWCINPTGNARLATAGTGDVLAGWLGGLWATQPDAAPLHLAGQAVWQHGRAAEDGPADRPMRAADLIEAMVGTSAVLA